MQQLSNPKVVFFDADDTLFTVKGSIGQTYCRLLSEFNVTVAPEELDRRIPGIWASFAARYHNEADGFVTSAEQERQNWSYFVRLLLQSMRVEEQLNFDQFFEVIYLEFGRASSRDLYPDVLPTLLALKEQGYELGVISNNDQRVLSVLEEFGLIEHFQHLYPTSLLGFKKPSPRCFEAALQRVGRFQPREFLYVGDNFNNDYRAAIAAGWQAIWLNRQSRPASDGVRQIRELGQIPELLSEARLSQAK